MSSRRKVLKGIGALAGVTAAGCGRIDSSGVSSPGEPPSPHGFPDKTPAPTPSPTPNPTPLTPEALLASVDTIVVLMMENRSFDHFLGSLKFIEGRPVDGLSGTETNPDPLGNPVPVSLLEDFTPEDPPHGWDAAHAQWNLGANDGFVKEHAGPSQAEAMGYHVRAQLPATYELADNFVVCDRWFSSVMGPTWPNRHYLHGATSGGVKSNTLVSGYESIYPTLAEAGVTSLTYFHDVPFQASFLRFEGLAGIEQFFTDAAAGTLKQYTVIDPKFIGADANDDHPDHDVQLGQALIASIYAALAASPQWGRCLFVVTYDENGGFYDHVSPPVTIDQYPGFEQMGFRVPSIVAGPMVKAGATVSTVFEHSSVIATLTKRFQLPLLNVRSAAAADLSSCIDPNLVVMPRPAPPIRPVRISRSRLADRYATRGTAGLRDQPELQELANQGAIPRKFDRRNDGKEVTRRWLSAGAKLGAVRLID